MNAEAPIAGVSSTTSITQASHVYDRLRQDLLAGRLLPGRKLPLRFLTETYATGQTPIREALNRLTSDGLVECREQRGFVVAGISRDELSELTRTRCWVEGLAVRHAIAAATPDWEERLVLAHHRLSRTPRSLNTQRFEDNPEWERLHRAFHRVVLSQCGSRPLIRFCEDLADQLYRYRMLSIRKAFTSRHIGDEHKSILEAILAGDAEAASSLLTAHYQRTADVLLDDTKIFHLGGDRQQHGSRRGSTFAIDSKLRGCDLGELRLSHIPLGEGVRVRTTIVQHETGRRAPFEMIDPFHDPLAAQLKKRRSRSSELLFPSWSHTGDHITKRQCARLVDDWVALSGLDPLNKGMPDCAEPMWLLAAAAAETR